MRNIKLIYFILAAAGSPSAFSAPTDFQKAPPSFCSGGSEAYASLSVSVNADTGAASYKWPDYGSIKLTAPKAAAVGDPVKLQSNSGARNSDTIYFYNSFSGYLGSNTPKAIVQAFGWPLYYNGETSWTYTAQQRGLGWVWIMKNLPAGAGPVNLGWNQPQPADIGSGSPYVFTKQNWGDGVDPKLAAQALNLGQDKLNDYLAAQSAKKNASQSLAPAPFSGSGKPTLCAKQAIVVSQKPTLSNITFDSVSRSARMTYSIDPLGIGGGIGSLVISVDRSNSITNDPIPPATYKVGWSRVANGDVGLRENTTTYNLPLTSRDAGTYTYYATLSDGGLTTARILIGTITNATTSKCGCQWLPNSFTGGNRSGYFYQVYRPASSCAYSALEVRSNGEKFCSGGAWPTPSGGGSSPPSGASCSWDSTPFFTGSYSQGSVKKYHAIGSCTNTVKEEGLSISGYYSVHYH